MKTPVKFYISLIYIGIIAGLIGTALTYLLHAIQQWAFAYGGQGEHISFGEGVRHSDPLRRWLILTFCGIIAGFGWFAIHRYGSKLLSVKQGLEAEKPGVPFLKTVSHALLQIITVGLGSPLGREVAPREMSVAFTSLWLRYLPLEKEEMKLLLACASGAGLTAVYNVPLAATIFILETMVISFTPKAMGAALLSVVLATCVSRFFLGDLVQYPHLLDFPITPTLIVFALLIGLIIGVVANLFRKSTQSVPWLKRTDKRIIPLAIFIFSLIGFISLYQPEILGNGKAGNQQTFHAIISAGESLQLMGLKWLVVILALAAGAYGGLITPSMMLGSTLAYSVAIAWNAYFPMLSLEGAAIIGACAFLGIMQKMPITAVIFLLELTRGKAEFLMPLTVAMAGAVLSDKLSQRWLK